jgi:hypothetical protein
MGDDQRDRRERDKEREPRPDRDREPLRPQDPEPFTRGRRIPPDEGDDGTADE